MATVERRGEKRGRKKGEERRGEERRGEGRRGGGREGKGEEGRGEEGEGRREREGRLTDSLMKARELTTFLDPHTWHRCRCRRHAASLLGSSKGAGKDSPSRIP